MDLEKVIRDAVKQAFRENMGWFVNELKGITKPPENELMTVEETTKFLKVSKPTIYRLMNAGELKFTKIGNRTLFHRADLELFINK